MYTRGSYGRQTLEEDDDAEDEDGGKEVGDVGEVGAGQGLAESAEL